MIKILCCNVQDLNHVSVKHGSLLSLNAWKLGPTPRNFEMVAGSHSNEPDNRCP